jgi:N-methylhydantoinase A
VEARRAPARQAYFGPQAGWLHTPVIPRADLTTAHQGPCIIEEYDATCVVPPGVTAVLDTYGNIVLELL